MDPAELPAEECCFDEEQAAAEVPTMRAMASAELQNLVFELAGDIRIIPAVLSVQTP